MVPLLRHAGNAVLIVDDHATLQQMASHLECLVATFGLEFGQPNIEATGSNIARAMRGDESPIILDTGKTAPIVEHVVILGVDFAFLLGQTAPKCTGEGAATPPFGQIQGRFVTRDGQWRDDLRGCALTSTPCTHTTLEAGSWVAP